MMQPNKVILLEIFFGLLMVSLTLGHDSDIQKLAVPNFDRPSENVTVIIGSFAILPCFVNNLGDHKVCKNIHQIHKPL